MDRFDITLVNMPFAMPLIAPLGVGVLCGRCAAGCRVRCRFANVDLAERVPEELYDYPASNGLNVDVMLADWLFAEPLFGPDPERDRRFLEILQDECGHDRVVWNGRYRSSGDLLRDVPLLKREAAAAWKRPPPRWRTAPPGSSAVRAPSSSGSLRWRC